MTRETIGSFAVADWLVEPELNKISTTSQSICLRPQLMKVLVYLAGLQGRVATLESIHDDLWVGKFVSSGTIYNCIAELRQALSRDGKDTGYIETIPKKGYRLAPPVVTMPVSYAGAEGKVTSVAIMPLNNHGGKADAEYLCEGVAEEILHRLSRVSRLKAISALALKGENLDARVVGLRYGTEMVLAGSLQRRGEHLRLTFRLERVSSGETIWSERYDQEMADIFKLQDAVANHLVNALSPMLGSGGSSPAVLENSGTASLEAFNAFLLGRHAESISTPQSYDNAIGFYERAVAIDPAFARAHYRLYLASYMKRRIYGADDTYLDRARVAATNAKKHDYRPAVPWVHIQRRLYRENRPSTRDLALEALEKIRNRDPEWGSFAYEQMTWVLPAAGYYKATLSFAKHMFDSATHNFSDSDADEELPYYYATVGRFEESIRLWSSEIQKDPARPLFRYNRSLLYARTGQAEYAARDLDTLEETWYRNISCAFYHFWLGRSDRIEESHHALLRMPGTHPASLLYTYSMLGDMDSALEAYAKSIDLSSRSFIDFGPLRAVTRAKLPMTMVSEIERHPRFQEILDREGIDDAWRVELMERVNDVADITGIRISPEDDVGL